MSYTIQHRTILTIFPLILQTIIIAPKLSAGGGTTTANLTVTQLKCLSTISIFWSNSLKLTARRFTQFAAEPDEIPWLRK